MTGQQRLKGALPGMIQIANLNPAALAVAVQLHLSDEVLSWIPA